MSMPSDKHDVQIEAVAKALCRFSYPARSIEEVVAPSRELWQRFIPEAEIAVRAMHAVSHELATNAAPQGNDRPESLRGRNDPEGDSDHRNGDPAGAAPTPRTDAAILRTVNVYVSRQDGSKRMVFEFVEAAFSRELERELSEYKARAESAEIAQVEAGMREPLSSIAASEKPQDHPKNINPSPDHPKKPTLAELEWILAAPDGYFGPVAMQPNGEIRATLGPKLMELVPSSAIGEPRVGLPLLYNIVCLWAQKKDDEWFKDMAELCRLADKLLYEQGYEVSPYTVNEHQIKADNAPTDGRTNGS